MRPSDRRTGHVLSRCVAATVRGDVKTWLSLPTASCDAPFEVWWSERGPFLFVSDFVTGNEQCDLTKAVVGTSEPRAASGKAKRSTNSGSIVAFFLKQSSRQRLGHWCRPVSHGSVAYLSRIFVQWSVLATVIAARRLTVMVRHIWSSAKAEKRNHRLSSVCRTPKGMKRNA